MMENEQKTLGNEGEKETRCPYRYIYSNTSTGFLNLLNQNKLDGYRIDTDLYTETFKRDKETGETFIKREAYLFDTEPVEEGLVNNIEIIEAMDKAEGYFIETSASLSDEKNRLLIDTDYDIVNAQRQAMDPPKPPVKTAPEKKAWVESQLTERENDLLEAKRWKKYVEAMGKRGELPQRESPWDKKARLKEEELRLKEELESRNIETQKVENKAEEAE